MEFPNILLRTGGSALRQERSPAWDTGWRTLPVCLLETPESGQWRVETEDGSCLIAAKQVLFIPAGLRHRLIAQCACNMISTWCMLDWEWRGRVLRFAPKAICLTAPRAHLALLQIAELNKIPEPSLPECARTQQLGLDLLQMLEARIRHDRVDDRIQRVVDILSRQPADSHPVSRLARAAGLSPSRFHELFGAQVGESPIQYLKSLRVRQAMSLLASTTLSQNEIAERCGFQSLPYFHRVFRAATGMAPGAFRQLSATLPTPELHPPPRLQKRRA